MAKLMNEVPLNEQLQLFREAFAKRSFRFDRTRTMDMFELEGGYWKNITCEQFEYPLKAEGFQKDFVVTDTFLHRQLWFLHMKPGESGATEVEKENFMKKHRELLDDEDKLKEFVLTALSARISNVEEQLDMAHKQLVVGLSLKRDFSERQALHELQQYYFELQNSTELFLQPFEGLSLTTRLSDLYLEVWMEFVSARIRALQPSAEGPNFTEFDLGGILIPEFELPPEFEATIKKGSGSLELNVKETALLFFLLRKHGAIQDLSNRSLARVLHLLTGYSEQNLRDKGLNKIFNFLEGRTESDLEYLNHMESFIRELLQTIEDYRRRIG